jgi:hypothetical protein
MTDFSDIIVFADESGDHGLQSIDAAFPMFALAFCVINKTDYVANVVPAFQKLKFDIWGHDGVILHEHGIRKETGDFAVLRTSRALRESFRARISGIVEAAPITVHAAAVNKQRLVAKYVLPWNPYDIALLFCMERLLETLQARGQAGKTVHVVFEGRGAAEDAQLELTFRRIAANEGNWGWKTPDFSGFEFVPRFEKKSCNSIGLQFADLIARPIALTYLRPDQPNRAADILRKKEGRWKCFP